MPGRGTGISPALRWLVLVWLVFTVLGLLLLGGGLVWLGGFADVSQSMAARLPRWVLLLLAVPVAVAVTGYSLAIWRLWRRRPAMSMWLIGMGGHASYLVADIIISGSARSADAFSWDDWGILMRLLAPGFILLMIERDRIENPDLR